MIDSSHILLCTPYSAMQLFSIAYLSDMATTETTGSHAENGGIAAESLDGQ